jgi:hypothetical protein
MKIPVTGAILGCMLLGVIPAPVDAAKAPSPIVRVDNGIATLSLGNQNLIGIRARRENYNAHSFDVVSFYFRDRTVENPVLNLVPIFGTEKGKHRERYEITVGGGADCNLDDFRLLKAQGRQPARLIVAHRDMGESFVMPGVVQFIYYDLKRNDDGVPGEPPLYFEEKSRANSRQKYCDVNDAFERELQMGASSGS